MPRPGSKYRELVLGLGVAGIALSPLGLITGPIGLWKGVQDLGQIKRGEAQSDGMLTAGMLICAASILISLFGAWYCWMVIDYIGSQGKIDRATAQLNQIGTAVENYANRHQKMPGSLEEVRKSDATLPDRDPWATSFFSAPARTEWP